MGLLDEIREAISQDLEGSGIYALLDSEGEVRYVGQATDLKRRYGQHCRLGDNSGHTHRQTWLRKLYRAGEKPGVAILDRSPDLEDAEEFWIGEWRAQGANLVNAAEVRRTMSQCWEGKRKMPWAPKQAPVQYVLRQLRGDIRWLRRNGKDQKARKIEAKADHIQKRASEIQRKGRDAWILFNARVAERLPGLRDRYFEAE